MATGKPKNIFWMYIQEIDGHPGLVNNSFLFELELN